MPANSQAIQLSCKEILKAIRQFHDREDIKFYIFKQIRGNFLDTAEAHELGTILVEFDSDDHKLDIISKTLPRLSTLAMSSSDLIQFIRHANYSNVERILTAVGLERIHRERLITQEALETIYPQSKGTPLHSALPRLSTLKEIEGGLIGLKRPELQGQFISLIADRLNVVLTGEQLIALQKLLTHPNCMLGREVDGYNKARTILTKNLPPQMTFKDVHDLMQIVPLEYIHEQVLRWWPRVINSIDDYNKAVNHTLPYLSNNNDVITRYGLSLLNSVKDKLITWLHTYSDLAKVETPTKEIRTAFVAAIQNAPIYQSVRDFDSFYEMLSSAESSEQRVSLFFLYYDRAGSLITNLSQYIAIKALEKDNNRYRQTPYYLRALSAHPQLSALETQEQQSARRQHEFMPETHASQTNIAPNQAPKQKNKC